MIKKSLKSSKTQIGRGLDIGTAFIVCAEKKGQEVVFRSQRNAFFDIEHTDFTKQMLTKSKVNYIIQGKTLNVVGDEALKFANLFSKEARRPLNKGVISPSEKEALPMVELILKTVIGRPRYPGEILYFSIPGNPLDADFDTVYHKNIFAGFLKKLGYKPKSIYEGLAVIFSELADENFTGIGISFGAGMVNVCLACMSVPVFTFSVTKAGDWIDRQVAKALAETASRVCAIKENKLDLTKEKEVTKIEQALSIYYDNLLDYVVENIIAEFERSKKPPELDKPITIVLSGGSTCPKGFLERFKQVLRKSDFPLAVGKVKMASEPLLSVAKGALVATLSDEENK